MTHTPNQRTDGFSLVEVIIAFGVMAMIMMTVAGVSVRSQQADSQTAGQTGATQILTSLSANIQQGRGKYTPPLPTEAGRANTYDLTRQDIADLFADQVANDYGNPDLYTATVSNLGATNVGGTVVIRYSTRVCYVNTFAESGTSSCLTQAMYGPRPSVSRTASGTNVAVGGSDSTPVTPTNPGTRVPRGDLKIVVVDEFSGQSAPTVTIRGQNFERSIRAFTSGYTLTSIPAGEYTVTVTPSSNRQSTTVDSTSLVITENQTTTVTARARKAQARVTFAYVAGENLTTNLRVETSDGQSFNMLCSRSCNEIRYMDVGTSYTVTSLAERQKARIDEFNAPHQAAVQNSSDIVHRIEVRSYSNPVDIKLECTWDGATVPCSEPVSVELNGTKYYINKDTLYNGQATWQYRIEYPTTYQQALAGTTIYKSDTIFPLTGRIGEGVAFTLKFKAYYNNVGIVFTRAFPENMPTMTSPVKVGAANFTINSNEGHTLTSVPGVWIDVAGNEGAPFTLENNTWRYVMLPLKTKVEEQTTPYAVQVKRQKLVGNVWVDSTEPLTTPPPPPPGGGGEEPPPPGGGGEEPPPNPDPDPEPEPDPDTLPAPYTFICGRDTPDERDGFFHCKFFISGPQSDAIIVPQMESRTITLRPGMYNVEATVEEIEPGTGDGFLTYGSFENIRSNIEVKRSNNNFSRLNGQYVYSSNCYFWFSCGQNSGPKDGGTDPVYPPGNTY